MTNQTTSTRPQTTDELIAFLIDATPDADDNGFVNVAKWNRSSDFGKLLDDAEERHFIERHADRKWTIRLAGDDEELREDPMTTAEMLETLNDMSMDVDTDEVIDFDRYAEPADEPADEPAVVVFTPEMIVAMAQPDERPVVDEDANLLHAWLSEATRKPTDEEQRQAAFDPANQDLRPLSKPAKIEDLEAKAKLAGHKVARPKAERKPGQPCHCGCGQTTSGPKVNFVQGHDAKAKSLLLKALKDDSIEIPDILADHVRNTPDWFARFGDLVSL